MLDCMLGTLLNGRYRIVRVLGSGGFGQTYVAEDTLQTGNPKCVVKQFKPLRQDGDFLHIARRLFANEATILGKLGSHDQIPALLADFEENQEFYLVQEFIKGQSLSEELAQVYRLRESAVVALLRDVLHVLEFVHRNQVIHRDIKPSNLIRRQRDGKIVLIDFGAVKEIQTQLTTSGQTGHTVGIGTHGYGPSEQLMGKPRFNSDLYALGMTAIQALTGMQPHQLPTHPETGEVIWQDQALVSAELAAILDKMVRYHFNQRFQSATQVLQALDATELPTAHTQIGSLLSNELETRVDRHAHTVVDAPRRRLRDRVAMAAVSIGVASAAVTGWLLGMRQIGWLQPLELAVFDRMVQSSPDLGPDPRLLIVGITEGDIQAQQRTPLPDRTIAKLLQRLRTYQPRVIGLDLLRDVPQGEGRIELLSELKTPNIIAITNLGSDKSPAIPPPPGLPSNRVGFNDFTLDPDIVVRRNLIFADTQTATLYSFALRVALAYLAPQGIALRPNRTNSNWVELGAAIFKPIERNAGGYQTIDARGYQILLKYRGQRVAQQVSLMDVLEGRVKPEWVKDKVVLIGTTAASEKDLFSTPFRAIEHDTPQMSGVLLHAHMTSQILSMALDRQPLFWFWDEWLEIVWIAAWAVAGGCLAWRIRHPVILGLGGTVLLTSLVAIGFSTFLHYGWIPIAAPATAAIATGGIIIAYRGYWKS